MHAFVDSSNFEVPGTFLCILYFPACHVLFIYWWLCYIFATAGYFRPPVDRQPTNNMGFQTNNLPTPQIPGDSSFKEA